MAVQYTTERKFGEILREREKHFEYFQKLLQFTGEDEEEEEDGHLLIIFIRIR